MKLDKNQIMIVAAVVIAAIAYYFFFKKNNKASKLLPGLAKKKGETPATQNAGVKAAEMVNAENKAVEASAMGMESSFNKLDWAFPGYDNPLQISIARDERAESNFAMAQFYNNAIPVDMGEMFNV